MVSRGLALLAKMPTFEHPGLALFPSRTLTARHVDGPGHPCSLEWWRIFSNQSFLCRALRRVRIVEVRERNGGIVTCVERHPT